MKKKYKYICMAAAVLLCLAAGAVYAMRSAPVQGWTVARGSLVKEFTAQATVIPERSTVLNAPSSGTVAELPYQAGSRVEAGECLVRTDSTSQISLDLQREELSRQLLAARQEYQRLYGENGAARSDLEAASSQYETAKRSYDSAKALADQGFVAQLELQELRTQMDIAFQRYLQAGQTASQEQQEFGRAQIESLERQLEASREAASPGAVAMPYDGVLWEVYVKKGEYLSQNQQTVRVYEEGNMKLEASVLSGDGASLIPGMEARVLYGDKSSGDAKIRFVARTAVQKLSSIGMEENRCTVELVADSIPEWAGAGQEVDVQFSVAVAENVLTVPAAAIVPEGDRSLVYVIRGGKARAARVETGRGEGGLVEILSGLTEGDVIASDPYGDSVAEGSRVSAELPTG